MQNFKGLLGNYLADPMTRMGMGLLARRDQNFGQALGGSMNDLYQQQQAQTQFDQQQMAMAQQQRQQEWMQQNMPNMVNAPPALQAQAFKSMYERPKVSPKMVLGPNGQPMWVNAPDAIGKPAYAKPLVSIDTQKNRLPTRQEILREDALAAANADRKWNTGVVSAAGQARSMLPSYRRALSLLDTVNTGTLEASKVEAKKLANALGFEFDPSAIADAEELQVYLGDQLMARIHDTKGAVSNKEMELFERFSGSFGKTTEGNKQILRFKIAQAERDMKLAKMVRSLQRQGKTSGEIRIEIEDYLDKNDLSGLLVMPGSENREVDNLLKKYGQ